MFLKKKNEFGIKKNKTNIYNVGMYMCVYMYVCVYVYI